MDFTDQSVSLSDQIKLASEWGYNQDEIIAALKINTKDSSKDFQPFESLNVMLDALNRVSNRSAKKMSIFQPGDAMSSSTSSLFPTHPMQTPPRRSSSVSRSSSFHLSTPRSTRDSHDIVRLLATLEKEKERDRKEVDSQFTILKNRIHFLELGKEHLQQENEDLRQTVESQEKDVKECKEEITTLMEEKLDLAESLDKLTLQNYKLQQELRKCSEELTKLIKEKSEVTDSLEKMTLLNRKQQQEIKVQKELAEHRRIISLGKDEEILNLQKQCKEIKTELESQSTDELNLSGLHGEDSCDLFNHAIPCLSQRTSAKHETDNSFDKDTSSVEQLRSLCNQFFDSYSTRIDTFQREKEHNKHKMADIEDRLNAKNREFQRMQNKCMAECCICLNTKPSVVFLPCRHLISCHECYDSSDLKECPTCRSYIDNSITVFM